MTEWGSRGTGNGQFRLPRGIGVDSTGHVYVADTFNHRVQKFTNDGTYVGQWGEEGSEPGQFRGPWSVTVDRTDAIYIVGVDNFRVQKFTADGIPVTEWGEPPEPNVTAGPG